MASTPKSAGLAPTAKAVPRPAADAPPPWSRSGAALGATRASGVPPPSSRPSARPTMAPSVATRGLKRDWDDMGDEVDERHDSVGNAYVDGGSEDEAMDGDEGARELSSWAADLGAYGAEGDEDAEVVDVDADADEFEAEGPEGASNADGVFRDEFEDPRDLEALAAAAWRRERRKSAIATAPWAANRSVYEESPYTREQAHQQQEEQEEEAAKTKWERHVQERARLPVRERTEEIIKKLTSSSSRVCCIMGEAGCGKSTQIPQLILEEAASRQQPARIVVTQPRRVAALALAQRVAFELGEGDDTLGKYVGYRIGGESKPGEYIDYCTTGYLLQLLVNAPQELARYTHVVLDEVHERSAESDMLCLVVKLLLQSAHSTIRVVVMSATLQADIFSQYFGQLDSNRAIPESIHVGGRCFPVKELYLEDFHKEFGRRINCKQLIDQRIKDAFAEDKIKRIDQRHCEKMASIVTDLVRAIAEPGTTILVFLPGISEISSLWEEAKALEDNNRYKVYPLHSMIPREEQEMVFQEPDPRTTNIVLSTDIAESSVTLPNVVAVIDLGLHRRVDHDPKRGMSALTLKWISCASAKQRSGRAGRTRPGICLRLFTRDFHDKVMAPFDLPESASMPLDRLYLQSKQLAEKLAGQGNNMPRTAQQVIQQMLQAPDTARIAQARGANADLGAIGFDDESAGITNLGHLCLQLPIEPKLARLVWLGVLWGLAADAVVLACVLSANDPFSAPSPLFIRSEHEFVDKLRNAASARLLFDGGSLSEPLMVRQLFLEWLVQLHQSEWLFGNKEWILKARRRHTWNFSHRFSLSRGRMEHVVSHVLDLALRTYRSCDERSKAAGQLRGLIQGLGYSINERCDLSPIAKADYKAFRMDGIFEEDPEYLKSLMAAAFNENLLIGSYGTIPTSLQEKRPQLDKQQELWKAIVSKKLPPTRTVAFPGKSVTASKYIEFVVGSAPERIVATDDKQWILAVLEEPQGDRWVPLDSRPQRIHSDPCRLPAEFNLLAQFQKAMQDMQRTKAGSGWSYGVQSFENPCILQWEWMQGSISPKGAFVRCAARLERKNAIGLVGYVAPDDPPSASLQHIAALAVSASVHAGEGHQVIFPDNVTVLPAGHIAFIIASAKHESKNNFEKFGFTVDGSLAIGHRCVDLPKNSVDSRRWKLIVTLRDTIRHELASSLDKSNEWWVRGSKLLLWDTPVEDAARKLHANVNRRDAILESTRVASPMELQFTTVSLATGHGQEKHRLSAFQALPSWSDIEQRRDEVLRHRKQRELEAKQRQAAQAAQAANAAHAVQEQAAKRQKKGQHQQPPNLLPPLRPPNGVRPPGTTGLAPPGWDYAAMAAAAAWMGVPMNPWGLPAYPGMPPPGMPPPGMPPAMPPGMPPGMPPMGYPGMPCGSPGHSPMSGAPRAPPPQQQQQQQQQQRRRQRPRQDCCRRRDRRHFSSCPGGLLCCQQHARGSSGACLQSMGPRWPARAAGA